MMYLVGSFLVMGSLYFLISYIHGEGSIEYMGDGRYRMRRGSHKCIEIVNKAFAFNKYPLGVSTSVH